MPLFLVMYSNEPPSSGHLARLEALGGGVRVAVADSEAAALRYAPEADVFLGHRYLWQSLPVAERLRWVQSTAGGFDFLLVPELFARRPLLTRTPIFSDIVAWHALALALAVGRGVASASHAAGAGETPGRIVPLGPPRRAVIYGFGAIGRALGTLLQGLGCHVTGVRRGRAAGESGCDVMVTPEVWLDSLPEADLLALTCPLTDATRGLVDGSVLRRLPQRAVLVNVARGAVVDHSALAGCVEEGRLAGAGLDVIDGATAEERARLARLPNVVYTPKVAGLYPERQARLEAFIESQAERFLQGLEPLHVIPYLSGQPGGKGT